MSNVAPGDLALLFYACHQENKGKACIVLRPSSYTKEPHHGPWWLVEFPEPVVTDTGVTRLSNIPDWRLRKLSGLGIQYADPDRVERSLSHSA